MHTFLTVLELLAGGFIVGSTLFDVFQAVVVPRWTPRALRLSPFFVDSSWNAWCWIGGRIRDGKRREEFLGVFAPMILVALLLVWVAALILGYGLALHALRHQLRPTPESFGDALYSAGTCLFTLGFGDIVGVSGLARAVMLSAAAAGLSVMAMVITLIFNLHTAFQRREVLVLTLDARAGAPPSGVTLLETHSELGLKGDLPALFASWEIWSAEVLESHRAFGILPFFRSSHVNESWVGALGAVLDAAALLVTTVDEGPQGAAQMMLGLGVHAVSDLNYWCRLPECAMEVGVEREEFEVAWERLERAGYRLRPPDEAWHAFVHKRMQYAGPLNALAGHFAMPVARWIGRRLSIGDHHMTHADTSRRRNPHCTHLGQIHEVTPSANGCEECLKTGDRWVHLRLCLTCGHVGCCDSSKNKHATKHYHATGHPIVRSHQPGEDWEWCYPDEIML